MQPYLESVSLALGDLVLGDAAVEHIPCKLVGVLPVIDQTNRTQTSHNHSTSQNHSTTSQERNRVGGRVKLRNHWSSLDDLHGHLDVAPLGELLHRVELRHERVPAARRTQRSTATQTLTTTSHAEARAKRRHRTKRSRIEGELGELTGAGGGGAGRRS